MRLVLPLLFVGFVIGCTGSGPQNVVVLQTTGAHCAYQMAPTSLKTINNLSSLEGKLGRVVTNRTDILSSPEVLKQAQGFEPITLQLSSSAEGYWPLDFPSIFSLSLYNTIEKTYDLMVRLNPQVDMLKLVPSMAETRIVFQGIRANTNGQNITNNAEYRSVTVKTDPRTTLDYIISFSTSRDSVLPYGMNIGVIGHEFTHMVFHYLFWESSGPGFTTDAAKRRESLNTLGGMDEGLADYFGYLVSGDPNFFGCSNPKADRDLSREKYFTSQMMSDIANKETKDYEPHGAGAVFAAINYQIGKVIGAEENGRVLLEFMRTLGQCSSIMDSNSLYITYSRIASCHAAVGGANSGTIQSTYSRYLSGGGQ